uniref:RxLR effector protein n=1 Tax=Phytophthora ramorum TaxID=164328 RepID=H3GHB4_PHYRM
MRGRSVFAGAMAVVALSSTLCTGAPKVDIRIVPRPRPEEEVPQVLLPVPSRDPLPAFQGESAMRRRPFVDELESLPCVREEREMQQGKAYTLDFCHLANVTIQAKIEEKVEVEVEVVADVPDTTEDGDSSAKLEEPVSEEKEKPEIPTILGIFRGWHIDPITMNYKYMIYDDGDECMDNDHYSMTVELIPSSNPESDTKLYGLKKTGMCTFKASLLTFVPEEDRVAAQGIHTPGVVDISDAEASLPVICGKMKCRYGDISKRVRDLSDQASKNTLESATLILEKSLEVFHEIEDLQQSLTNDFLGREEAARKEIAKQEANGKQKEEQKNATEADKPVTTDTLDKQDQVTAES